MIETKPEAIAFLTRLVYADEPGSPDVRFLITRGQAMDIIALLKEKDKYFEEKTGKNRVALCGCCGKKLSNHYKCSNCGALVKYE